MKRLELNKIAFSTALILGTLTGCGAGDDPEPTSAPTPPTTSATLSGSVVKGTLTGADILVVAINGTQVNMDGAAETDSSGQVVANISSAPGYAFNGMHKITATADSNASMICDAVMCGDVPFGADAGNAVLGEAKLSTLTWVSVPLGQQGSGDSDTQFQVNMLTTLASMLIEDAMAGGKNISSSATFEPAQAEYSTLLMRILGVDTSNADVFGDALISAESAQNFSEAGNTLLHMSLLNAAFAHIAEGSTLAANITSAKEHVRLAASGDLDAAKVLRQQLHDALAQHPVVAELGLNADELVLLDLPIVAGGQLSGPQQEITTAENIASATITARNRIGEAEAEQMAFDGDVNTKWLDHNDWSGYPTEEDPSWIQIQFDQPQAVNTLYITSANDAPDRDPENFNLQASNDGEAWVTLAQWAGVSFDERLQRQAFAFANGLEYIFYRLNITKNKNNDGLMQLAEIEMVGPVYTSKEHTDPVGTGTITARNRIGDAEAEEKAFDNDPQTKWLDHNDWQGPPTEEEPSWIQVDFPNPVAVNLVAITSANDAPERDPENFQLLASNDGGNTWRELASWAGESFDDRFERKPFSLNNTLAYDSYRLNITKNRNDDGLLQIGEIELIGPEVADEVHSDQNGVTFAARNSIGEAESEDKAFDGDINTKWLDHNDWSGAPTVEDPSWVRATLPEAKAVNRLAITSANDAPERDPENFFLQGSDDGENWVTLETWAGESFDERFERKEWTFSNSLAYKMYQLNITKNSNDDGLMQVAEIELIGPVYASVNHAIADDVTYSARNSIGEAESEDKAFDGDINTKWLDHNDWNGAPTEENPSWIQVDFDTPRVVDSLAITSANDAPERDPENFQLLGSNDGGATWEVVANWAGESFDERFERKSFPFSNGFAYSSYRLNITKNMNDDGLVQIAEIELIGPGL